MGIWEMIACWANVGEASGSGVSLWLIARSGSNGEG